MRKKFVLVYIILDCMLDFASKNWSFYTAFSFLASMQPVITIFDAMA